MNSETKSAESEFYELLNRLLIAAKSEFGESEYKYYQVMVYWILSTPDREGYHAAGDRAEITKAEYDANLDRSIEAMQNSIAGTLKTNYIRVEREAVKRGWKERLIAIINEA